MSSQQFLYNSNPKKTKTYGSSAVGTIEKCKFAPCDASQGSVSQCAVGLVVKCSIIEAS